MRILVAGDYCINGRMKNLQSLDEKNNILKDVMSIIKESDYAIVNLECPIVEGDAIPIHKQGPHLKSEKWAISILKNAGFHCVTLANNHFLDFGIKGVDHTIKTVLENGMDYVGGGLSLSEASETLYKNVKQEKIAIINCCEHEFSIATKTTPGANPLNTIQQYYKIIEAKKKADYVLVIVHGGHEHYQLPSIRMKELYHFFIDAGADVVINHHQHCYSGYEVYKEKLIFYGLGNFCFDWEGKRNSIWNKGYMVLLSLNKEKIDFMIYPYTQCNTIAVVKKMQNTEVREFENNLYKLNDIILDDTLLRKHFENFGISKRKEYEFVLEPFMGRIMRYLYKRNLIHSFLSTKRRIEFADFIGCESHHDLLMYIIHSNLE